MLSEILQSGRACRSNSRRRTLRALLADHVRGFKTGVYSTIYLPLAYPLDRFACFLAPLLQHSDVYSAVTSILRELRDLRDPYRPRELNPGTRLCIETALLHDSSVHRFVDRYLAVNRATVTNIARVLLEQPCVEGSIEAMYKLLLEDGFARVFRECKSALRKSLSKLATVYDALLVLLGVAHHYNPVEVVRVALGLGKRSCLLRHTAFTQAFIYVMLGNFPVESYIEAYRALVECAVRLHREPLGYTTQLCSEELGKWRHIGVDTDHNTVRELVRTIYALVDEALKW
jgi:hypothetical protein